MRSKWRYLQYAICVVFVYGWLFTSTETMDNGQAYSPIISGGFLLLAVAAVVWTWATRRSRREAGR